jgi:hypothetical protein
MQTRPPYLSIPSVPGAERSGPASPRTAASDILPPAVASSNAHVLPTGLRSSPAVAANWSGTSSQSLSALYTVLPQVSGRLANVPAYVRTQKHAGGLAQEAAAWSWRPVSGPERTDVPTECPRECLGQAEEAVGRRGGHNAPTGPERAPSAGSQRLCAELSCWARILRRPVWRQGKPHRASNRRDLWGIARTL